MTIELSKKSTAVTAYRQLAGIAALPAAVPTRNELVAQLAQLRSARPEMALTIDDVTPYLDRKTGGGGHRGLVQGVKHRADGRVAEMQRLQTEPITFLPAHAMRARLAACNPISGRVTLLSKWSSGSSIWTDVRRPWPMPCVSSAKHTKRAG